MSLKLLAIDLGKRSFHCYGIDERWRCHFS